ncbi:hypothetical protein ACFYVL_08890 [Streptomyces sp. NPDC004111]|uniref:hypothetical protein n=1 Tax=Streptomyces sp. NPDC004111 TaxID=3364690 RepID=UPI003690A830
MVKRRRARAPKCGSGRFAMNPRLLFGGVYGTILASSMVAALTPHKYETPGGLHYNALWLLVTAFAAALAHGYAHFISHGLERRHSPRELAGRIVSEWPLMLATAPSVALLLGADIGLWASENLEVVILSMNIFLLFAWGLAAGRTCGRTWPGAVLVGAVDALLGVAVVVANSLIK